MENNILNKKSMEDSLTNREQELIIKIKKLEEENSKLQSENLELNNKLSSTEIMLQELREERKEAERRHKEAMENSRKEHEETIKRIEKESDEALQRHLTQINELRTSTAKIINSVKNTVKTNTDNKINVTSKEPQKEVLRLFINKEDLNNEDVITIKINRCQRKYLKKLEPEELQLGKLLETPNAISTLNKFIETSSINITRLTSNKLQTDIDKLELFQNEFKTFVINSQSLNELEIISEEVNNEIRL